MIKVPELGSEAKEIQARQSPPQQAPADHNSWKNAQGKPRKPEQTELTQKIRDGTKEENQVT